MKYVDALTLHRVWRDIHINATFKELFLIWVRRCASFTGYLTAWAVMMVSSPILITGFLIADIILKSKARWSRTRCILFALLYLNCEVFGLAAAFIAWLASGRIFGFGKDLFIRMNLWLQSMWAWSLFAGSKKLFSVSFEVEGEECLSHGPYVLFIRHVSLADTIIPSIFITRRFGVVLRYVFKKELLWDPCLDVVGNRLPNAFINRSGSQTAIELNAIRRLCRDMGPQDGIMLYPEGTRFSQGKRDRALQRLRESGHNDLYDAALRMTHLLPPRIGGARTILETARDADAVFCAHTGFEGAAHFSDFWSGVLVGQTIRIGFWRIPAKDIPRNDRSVQWLYDQWRRVDRWIDSRRAHNRTKNRDTAG